MADDWGQSLLAPNLGSVAVGGSATGTREDGADRDWFAVTLVAGQSYIFQANSTSALDPQLTLRDSNGIAVGGNDDANGGNNAQLNFRAPVGGTYYVDVGSVNGGAPDGLGAYTVSAAINPSPPAPPTDDYGAQTGDPTVGTIAVGTPASGTINYDGDQDWFAVTLTANQAYIIRQNRDGTSSLDPFLVVRNSIGTELTSNDDGDNGTNSLIQFTPTITGTYYLDARSFQGSGTGAYTISIDFDGAPPPPPVDDYASQLGGTLGAVTVNGGTVSGNINFGGDHDWFAVTLAAGVTYRFNDNGVTLPDPRFSLRDSNGTLLPAGNDDFNPPSTNAQFDYTATYSGVHYIDANSPSNTETGTYTVSVTQLNTAPVLNATASPVLNAVNEDAGAPTGAVGTLVSSLVDLTIPAGGLDNVTDVDGPPLGIALTGTNTTNGSWFYSVNGGASWNAMGSVSNGAARLLLADANTRLYFQPSPGFDGAVADAITFRAWDGSVGGNGGLGSTATNGGTTAFSTATDTAGITVNPVPTVSINSVSAPEGTSLVFTVSLSAASAQTVTVNYATANGTASSTSDYGATSGTVTFAPGEMFKPVVVSVSNDSVYEEDEDFTVVLSGATNATISSVNGTGTGTIGDSADLPIFDFSSASYSITEGNAGTSTLTIRVNKSGATEVASSVNYTTANGTGTAGSDYVATSGTLNFLAGEISKTFTITINGDTTVEPNENFTISLNTPSNAALGAQSTATATILNDDNAPPTATNLNAAETYTEDQTALDLTDIVVTDTDSANVTVTLTLSVPSAGTLSTGTSNAVTSTFVGGVWTASGATADVNALLAAVTFTPASNFNSAFSLATSVSDGTSTITGSKVFLGTAVNDPPVATGESYSVNEDGTLTVGGSGVLGNDVDVENSPLSAVLGGGPVHGSLTLNANGSFVYTPDANYNGPDSFSYRPNDGTDNGNLVTVNITVNSVSDAPVGTAVAVTFAEDTRYTFTLADFGFTDQNDTPADTFVFVRIASFNTTGTVYLDSDGSGPNAPVDQNAAGAGMYISAADIAAGHLYYTPAANAVGSSSFTFQVQDDGTTTNGGVNLDPTARTFTLTTTSVNDAPAGADATLTILEDTPRSFTAADFGFSDTSDSPANALLGVVITTLPTAGTLTLDGFGLSVGQVVPVADIPDLVFTPALNANGTGYATFTFQVQDNGGTADSGVDLDPSANTIGFNVTSVNDAPAGTNANQSVVEGTSRVLTLSDFGFTDVDSNNFISIRVSALPGAGRLTFDADATGPGAPASATVGQIVTVADIMAGKLAYETPSGANNGATSFSFQVQDDGGTLNGGVDLDASANTITYTITPATPPGPPPPVTIGNTTFIEGDYVQPTGSTATVISPRVQADNIALNITGNAGTQTIIGNYGPNALNDGGGADTLIGLLNNDTYIVSNSGTVVVENNGEGMDTVLTSTSYILPTGASIENLSAQPASGTSPVFLTGNAGDQRITGNNGDNIINGLGGSDTMAGMGGNDTYLVRGPGDVVIEANGEGTDTLYTTVSYNLGENEVEVMSTVTQTDTTPINLVGNYLSQTIVGNYGDNLLNGGSGVDTLIGLFGNDLYAVGDSRIVIIEADGQGTDTVVTSVNYTLGADVSVEVLAAQIRSSTTGLALTGNAFGQTIAGTEGADTINGGAGSDVLIGGGGADRFDFTTLLGSSNVDAITDFGAGDRIGLSTAIFGAIGATLDAGEFVVGTAAADADDRIVYDQTSGQLFYDADGNGSAAAVLFAVVTPGTILSSANFEVIAP